MEAKSNWFPIKFRRVWICETEPFWKQIFGVYRYGWDETPYGLTIRILGFDFEFDMGKWED